jgi:hypothetical protein
MMRARVATFAVLLMGSRSGCEARHTAEADDPLSATAAPAGGTAPAEHAAPAEDDTAAFSRMQVTTEAPAEPEREGLWCDTEHPAPAPSPDLRLYTTWQKFPLRREEHGIDGTLRVLQDSRFAGPHAVRHGTHPAIPPCDPLPGRIEVLDASGTPVQATELWPQVDVRPYTVDAHQTLYHVEELVQCLASCWCGNDESFYRVAGGRFVRLESRRPGGEVTPVRDVVAGCFGGARVARGEGGRFEVEIHRTVLIIPGALSVTERHWWDGTAWQGSVVERKIPW